MGDTARSTTVNSNNHDVQNINNNNNYSESRKKTYNNEEHHSNKVDGDITTGNVRNMQGMNNKGKQCFGAGCLMNLNLQGASQAIIATPEQAMALINMNNQLEQPYEIKGAYLI